MMLRRLSCLTLIAVALALAGCGGNKLVPVAGTVSVGEKRLERGNVTFHPVRGGPVATGTIGPDGAYSLRTGNEVGAAPGEYKVTVVATADLPKASGPLAREVAPKLLIPEKYGKPESSGLAHTVPPGGGTIEIRLK